MARDLAVAARRHGGALAAARAAYPLAPAPWIDLSTGINPTPWPGARAPAEALRRLPDPDDLARLEMTAATAFGVADASQVVATSGAEAALRLLPHLLGVSEAAIVGPTYGGHGEAWAAAGARRREISLEDLAECPARLVVLVHPNNPDGRRLPREDLRAMVSARSARGAWTLVDESFVETAPELSLAGERVERLIVLRSFGKFYGLPGARLGFLIAEPALAAEARAMLGDWPVSADALALGLGAYADTAWRTATAGRLAAEAAAFDQDLAAADLPVIGGTSLFRLVRRPDAGGVFERLCARGVLTRPFEGQGDWLRLGLPAPCERERVRAALQEAGRWS